MRRIVITIEYDGGAFLGWQAQQGGGSVQQAIEAALFKVTGENITVTGSGRTDTGVHALAQVAHFDTAKDSIPAHKFAAAINFYLSPGARVLESGEGTPDFHARFAAKRKTYRYQIVNADTVSLFNRKTHTLVKEPLNISKMREAAKHLKGKHDFTSFVAAGGKTKSNVRTIYAVSVKAAKSPYPQSTGERQIQITVTANGFLYRMVRIIAAYLISVGKGELEPENTSAVLAAQSREYTRGVAEPQGLFLVGVEY